MSYEKTQWTQGDKITAEKLNNMEDGIEELSGTVPSVTSADNGKVLGVENGEYALTEVELANGSVTTGKLANNAVTTDKIASGAVGFRNLHLEVEKRFEYRTSQENGSYGAIRFHKIGRLCIGIPVSSKITIQPAASGTGIVLPTDYKLGANVFSGDRIGIGTDGNGNDRMLICAGKYGTEPLIMLFDPKTESSIQEGGDFFGILVYESAL